MFELVYWCGINNDQGECINFGIDKFLKFTNESGQVNIIPIENINRLKELD